MINRNEWVDDFQKNISDLIARSPAGDIERNMRAFMTQAFSRLDLVTREEFDVQVQLLERALQRIAALESRLDSLEGRRPAPSAGAAPGATPGLTPMADVEPGPAIDPGLRAASFPNPDLRDPGLMDPELQDGDLLKPDASTSPAPGADPRDPDFPDPTSVPVPPRRT